MSPGVDADYVLGVFERVRALAPDIVVFTGDFTEPYRGFLAQAGDVYRRTPLGRLATVGIFGNHDYGPGWRHPEFAAALQPVLAGHGIRVLRNEVVDVAGLDIIGLDDWWAKAFHPATALAYRDAAKPGLVLSHNPTADLACGRASAAGSCPGTPTAGVQAAVPPPPLLRGHALQQRRFALDGGRRLYLIRASTPAECALQRPPGSHGVPRCGAHKDPAATTDVGGGGSTCPSVVLRPRRELAGMPRAVRAVRNRPSSDFAGSVLRRSGRERGRPQGVEKPEMPSRPRLLRPAEIALTERMFCGRIAASRHDHSSALGHTHHVVVRQPPAWRRARTQDAAAFGHSGCARWRADQRYA